MTQADRLQDKVVLVTGAAKGQGRSHCLRLAAEGADVIALDLCADVPLTRYAQGTSAQLAETASLVEQAGRRVVTAEVDVRDAEGMAIAVAKGVDQLGGLDVVVANAGIMQLKAAVDITPEDWATVLAINLTGPWNTVQACLPTLLERGAGSIVIISSAAGLKGPPHMAHYSAAKTGLVGLMRSLANELGPQGIRVNSVHPTTVDTDMVHWPQAYALFRPDLPSPSREDVEPVFTSLNVLPVPWISPSDVSEAVLFLASEQSRFVTGVALPVDAGTVIK